jgi:hypothetical protein
MNAFLNNNHRSLGKAVNKVSYGAEWGALRINIEKKSGTNYIVFFALKYYYFLNIYIYIFSY